MLSRELYRPDIVYINIVSLVYGRSNMRSGLYCLQIGIMADLIILWVVPFNVLVASPSYIWHLSRSSDGLTSVCISLDVKVLWEGTSWHRTSKISSSRSVILVAPGTLATAILTCDTSLVTMKYGSCTASRSYGSISVSCTLLCNAFVSLLESVQIEDLICVGMSGLSTDNPLTVVVLVTRCQHKQLWLTYRVVPSRPLQGRWFPLVFPWKVCLAHWCGDSASG